MQKARGMVACAALWCSIAFQPAAAVEGSGLKAVSQRFQPQLQGLFWVDSPLTGSSATLSGGAAARLRNWALVANYYFSMQLPAAPANGFRVTGGFVSSGRASFTALGSIGLQQPSSYGLGLQSRRSAAEFEWPPLSVDDSGLDSTGAATYVGLGYSSSDVKSGWGFSADLGLLALNSHASVKLGRASTVIGAQNLDDVLRELRLSPMLRVGVSYSF